MRLSEDVLRCVIFIGHASGNGADGGDGFVAKGTGFFVQYKNTRYLVTAQHIAKGLGDDPFAIRFNRVDGGGDVEAIDPVMDGAQWHCNTEDEDVDLAVMPFDIDLRAEGWDALTIPQAMLTTPEKITEWDIGVGDLCYAVGLFRLLQGKRRNLPVVHTGNIALAAGSERIPMRDWLGPRGTKVLRHVDGYLVEAQNLKGLSGAPVFVRPSMGLFSPMPDNPVGLAAMRFHSVDVLLLGIWSASWDAKPDEVLALEAGQEVRVPVGLGTVVPTSKLIELLERNEVIELRRKRAEAIAASNAAYATLRSSISEAEG